MEGAVTRVDTETATLSEIVDEWHITELPLNGRNPMKLVLLIPGDNNDVQGGAGGVPMVENQPPCNWVAFPCKSGYPS